jgi:hypothetical protein
MTRLALLRKPLFHPLFPRATRLDSLDAAHTHTHPFPLLKQYFQLKHRAHAKIAKKYGGGQ